MIDISKIDDLSFTISFDPQMTSELSDVAGSGTVEDALSRILSDALLGANHYPHFDCDLDDDVPF